MPRICFFLPGDKFHLPRRFCIDLYYIWPPHLPHGPDPGPLDQRFEIGGKPIGADLTALAGLAHLSALKGLSKGIHEQLKSVSEHLVRELQSQLPEGMELQYEARS
jgi:hypothetical protein